MWIYTPTGFISVVAHKDKSDILVVRSRFRDDIEAVLGLSAVITETTDSDYRYRTFIARQLFATRLHEYVMEKLTYKNVKDATKETWRHNMMFDIWDTTAREGDYQHLPPDTSPNRQGREWWLTEEERGSQSF